MNQTTEIEQIVIEHCAGDEWTWDAFGREKRITGSVNHNLAEAVDTLRAYLVSEGICK